MIALRSASLVVIFGACVSFSFTLQAEESLDKTLTPYLANYHLPAVAAAVVKDGRVTAIGAVGNRRAGTNSPVTVDDKFHLGSDTKAMTALLVAMEVEAGKLSWDTTVAQAFPEFAKEMDPGLAKVTVKQLLSHTSGLPNDNEKFMELLAKAINHDGDLDEMRLSFVQDWVKEPLVAKPGEKFAYSNAGFMLLGAIVEKLEGRTWEELVTEKVFDPLKLTSAGLGPQATVGRVDATLGHVLEDGKLKPFLAGPNGDNPIILGPAGTAHMSVRDFATWAGYNAGEGKRGPNLVKPETLKLLHTPVIQTSLRKRPAPGTPPDGKYCLGWGELNVDWADKPMLFHGGSNTKCLAHIWVDPEHDFAMVMMTNVSNPTSEDALFALAQELFKKYGP